MALNAWLPGRPLAYCIAKAECKVVFADAERTALLTSFRSELPTVRELISIGDPSTSPAHLSALIHTHHQQKVQLLTETIKPDDEAVIFFTSGQYCTSH